MVGLEPCTRSLFVQSLKSVLSGSSSCLASVQYRAGRDDVTTGKLFPSRGECLGLYRCVLIIFKRK